MLSSRLTVISPNVMTRIYQSPSSQHLLRIVLTAALGTSSRHPTFLSGRRRDRQQPVARLWVQTVSHTRFRRPSLRAWFHWVLWSQTSKDLKVSCQPPAPSHSQPFGQRPSRTPTAPIPSPRPKGISISPWGFCGRSGTVKQRNWLVGGSWGVRWATSWGGHPGLCQPSR